MNPELENKLAARIQHEMNALGELTAPPALASRILQDISRRTAVPWYRRAWQSWPLALRGASLLALAALFGGICVGVVDLSQAAKLSPVGQQAQAWFASLGMLWRTAGVVADAVTTAIQHLGLGILLGFSLVLFVVYAACFGLGTMCIRLAWARR